jgi:hypothetical protein
MTETKGIYNANDNGVFHVELENHEKYIKFYSRLPNVIDDMGLSLIAHRLYCHLKRVVGEDGECWQSRDTLAFSCGMSAGSVTNAKEELIERQLIIVRKVKGSNGIPYHRIVLVDIWKMNFNNYVKVTT